jgi:hypothetical protein
MPHAVLLSASFSRTRNKTARLRLSKTQRGQRFRRKKPVEAPRRRICSAHQTRQAVNSGKLPVRRLPGGRRSTSTSWNPQDGGEALQPWLVMGTITVIKKTLTVAL